MVGYTSKLAIIASAASIAMAAPAPVASPPADAFLPFANSRMSRRSHKHHDDNVKLVQLGLGTALLTSDRHHHHARSPRRNKHAEEDYPVRTSGKHRLSANAGLHADLADEPAHSGGKKSRKGKSSSGKKGQSGSGSRKHRGGKSEHDLERRRHSGWWPNAWAGSAYYPRPIYSHPYYAQPVVVGGYGGHAHVHIHARDLAAGTPSSSSAAAPSATAAPATPGFVELALPLDHSDLAKPYAGLFVDPDDPETLSTSATKASQFFLEAFAPVNAAPAASSSAPASSAAAPMATGHSFLAGDKLGNASVVQVRMPIMDAQSIAVSYACATIPSDAKETLTMQPCGGNDPTTSSQAFAYNSTTGELRPLMNELTHSATDGAVNGGILRPLDHPVNVPAAAGTDSAAVAPVTGTAVTSAASGTAVGATPAAPALPISFFFVPAGPNQLAAIPPPASASASSSAMPSAASSAADGQWTPSTQTDSAPYDWSATSTASASAAPTAAW